MFSKALKTLKEEYNSYSFSEKVFITMIMICCFAITGEASITRATANSVFLSHYTVKWFPYVWLASVPLNLLLVSFYNHFLPRIGCVKMLMLSILCGLSVNCFSAFYLKTLTPLPFFLYLWKDLYVILMFQQLWSVIHATVNISRAKYLYGIVFGMGGLGSVIGSLVPGFFAVLLGSEKLLLTTIPFYGIIALGYFFALSAREKIATRQDISLMSSNSTDILGGMKLIRRSKFLLFILFIVVGMQVASTLLDYQFSSLLERAFPMQDERTQFLGRFFGIVNTINIGLQFFGSYILLRLIGLERAHFSIPLILSLSSLVYFMFPYFGIMCFYFGVIKALDYSVFGIIKEMLYIPLKVDEKFKAKAIIDVFAYRTSKAAASFIILGMSVFSFIPLLDFISWGIVAIFILWMVAVMFMFKHYYREVKRQHINWPESILKRTEKI